MNKLTYQPIGTIYSDHQQPKATPIQPVFAQDCEGRIELAPEWVDGLKDLDGYSHMHLLYHLHQAGAPRMRVIPFMDTEERGLFATRHPCRPNPIGLSLVELIGIEGNVIRFKGADILNGTPLLDIKPFVPRFDQRLDARGGWTEDVNDAQAQDRGLREYPGQEGDV